MEEIFKIIGHVESLIPCKDCILCTTLLIPFLVSPRILISSDINSGLFGDERTCHTLMLQVGMYIVQLCTIKLSIFVCHYHTNSNLFCHFSLAIYVTWFLFNPRLNDCIWSFSSKCMNSFLNGTQFDLILVFEDALQEWLFWSCMQKKVHWMMT